MKKLKIVLNSFLGSVLITCIILTISFFLMLFSSGSNGFRTAYFESVFFESLNKNDGSIQLKFGLYKGLPIILTIIVIFLFILLTYYFYYVLKIKREKALEELKLNKDYEDSIK
ncbi:hypothetical protein ACXAUS_003668 [Clostridium sporogenes]|uniref:hypothetical protein n=1 Tax=Clostridium sporogenes TaxID=1509 RepID=UPI002903CE3E|nr:hypothetical protein [Clostridium botulinum]